MPTPLARFLRALGGAGRLSPETLRRIGSAISCTDARGPDFDLPVRFALNDLSPAESRAYLAHIRQCPFCSALQSQALNADWHPLRELLMSIGIELSAE